MGGCVSCQKIEDGNTARNAEIRRSGRRNVDQCEGGIVGRGDYGSGLRLHRSSSFISMHSRQGKKGVNQDSLTVWKNFTGQKGAYFYGVFDGHGPNGHKVSRFVSDILPSKLSLRFINNNGVNSENEDPDYSFFSKWKSNFLNSFREVDEELQAEPLIDTDCSGTTAVTILRQDEHLVIGNLGDSRAIICTREDSDQLVVEQLTVDLKPNLPSEYERVTSCNGRVIAMDEEPNVFRVWMPGDDGPGLAMARAFGDFCLKNYGIISVPEMYYRKLTERDEFVVLASDGIWDVLSNEEVTKIVSSVKKRSIAARVLVERAVKTWKYRYPFARIDDCTVICFFFKPPRPILTKSTSGATDLMSLNSTTSTARTYDDDGLDTVLNYRIRS